MLTFLRRRKGLLDGVAETSEQQQKFLETAYRRTGEMEILLEQLFFFSKMEPGNLPVALEAVEIGAFLSDYVQTAGSGQERITLNTNGISAEVMADIGYLRRILDNLLENSRKYAARELLEIDIVLRRNAVSERCFLWQEECSAFAVNCIESKP